MPKALISSSVMPSEKYSKSGSLPAWTKGMTATEGGSLCSSIDAGRSMTACSITRVPLGSIATMPWGSSPTVTAPKAIHRASAMPPSEVIPAVMPPTAIAPIEIPPAATPPTAIAPIAMIPLAMPMRPVKGSYPVAMWMSGSPNKRCFDCHSPALLRGRGLRRRAAFGVGKGINGGSHLCGVGVACRRIFLQRLGDNGRELFGRVGEGLGMLVHNRVEQGLLMLGFERKPSG